MFGERKQYGTHATWRTPVVADSVRPLFAPPSRFITGSLFGICECETSLVSGPDMLDNGMNSDRTGPPR